MGRVAHRITDLHECPVTRTTARDLSFGDRYPDAGWCSECDGWHDLAPTPETDGDGQQSDTRRRQATAGSVSG
jgi:hypothetical protein